MRPAECLRIIRHCYQHEVAVSFETIVCRTLNKAFYISRLQPSLFWGVGERGARRASKGAPFPPLPEVKSYEAKTTTESLKTEGERSLKTEVVTEDCTCHLRRVTEDRRCVT